jgi:hypothetical protein
MKIYACLGALLLAAISTGSSAQASTDAVGVDPDVHKVVLEN